MPIVIATSLVVLNAACVLLVLLGLPGTWLMVTATALVAWWRWDVHGAAPMFGVPMLVTIVGLALAGEVAEFVAGIAGTKSVGGTRRGSVGALVGTLVGALIGTALIPLPIVGSLIGACAGAAVGAWGFELSGGRSMKASMRSGVGAGVGRLFGTVAKFVIAIAIWVVITVAAYWP
jgi:uncharacterized protein YqgC (DUF456 family)